LNVIDGKEAVRAAVTESTEVLWNRRNGHFGFRTLEIIATNQMVGGFHYQKASDNQLCEPCIDSRDHRSVCPSTSRKRATEIPELVHSDACGMLDTKSLFGC